MDGLAVSFVVLLCCVIFIVLKVRRPRELDELSTCHNALKFNKKCNLGNSHCCLSQRFFLNFPSKFSVAIFRYN